MPRQGSAVERMLTTVKESINGAGQYWIRGVMRGSMRFKMSVTGRKKLGHEQTGSLS